MNTNSFSKLITETVMYVEEEENDIISFDSKPGIHHAPVYYENIDKNTYVQTLKGIDNPVLTHGISIVALACLKQSNQKIDFVLKGTTSKTFLELRSDIIKASNIDKKIINKDDIL